jgi:hypothetical protein
LLTGVGEKNLKKLKEKQKEKRVREGRLTEVRVREVNHVNNPHLNFKLYYL